MIIYQSIKFAERLEGDRLVSKTVLLEDFESIEPVSRAPCVRHASPFVEIQPTSPSTQPKPPSIFYPATKTISFIIPAYNEEDRLGSTLDEVLSFLMSRRNRIGPHFTYEVIIVDDGSKDGTVRVASAFVKKHGFDAVRVLKVVSNRGKGHAVKRGMLISRGERMLLMDADGATKLQDLELLERELDNIETIPAISSSDQNTEKLLSRGKNAKTGGSKGLASISSDLMS